MDEDTRKQNKHFALRVALRGLHGTHVIFFVLVVSLTLYFATHHNDVKRRLEVLRAGGYPTSFAELAEYTRLPEGVENAADVYTRALGAFVPPADEVNTPVLGNAKWPDRGAPLSEPTIKAIADCLAANQRCLTLLHEAAGIEHCRFDYDYAQVIPQMPERGGCVRLLCVAATYHAHQGEANAAITCLKDALRLSDSLRREPGLSGYLARHGFVRLALEGLERSLNLTVFTDQQLREVDDALTQTGNRFDLTEALVTDRCILIEMGRDPSRFGGSGRSAPTRAPVGLGEMWIADVLDYAKDCIDACRLPPLERLARFREMDRRMQHRSLVHTITKILTPAVTRVVELDLRRRAHLDLARAALAIERHRLTTGQVPDKVEELVPRYLEHVPIDPFDGQPIRYRRTPPGYVLYSVDRDGRDNGGRERSDKDRDAPYDLCFIVTR